MDGLYQYKQRPSAIMLAGIQNRTGLHSRARTNKRAESTGKKVIAIMSLYFDLEKTESFGGTSYDCNQEVINRIGMMLNERKIAFSFSKPFKEAVLCMDAPATQFELEIQLQQLKDNLKIELEIETIYGVGEAVDDFYGAPQSYMQAKEASSFRFLAEYGELLFFNKMKTGLEDLDEARSLILKTNGIIKNILYSVQKCDVDESSLLVDDFLSALRENHSISKMLLNSFFTQTFNGFNLTMAANTYENINEEVWGKKGFVTDFTTLDSLS